MHIYVFEPFDTETYPIKLWNLRKLTVLVTACNWQGPICKYMFWSRFQGENCFANAWCLKFRLFSLTASKCSRAKMHNIVMYYIYIFYIQFTYFWHKNERNINYSYTYICICHYDVYISIFKIHWECSLLQSHLKKDIKHQKTFIWIAKIENDIDVIIFLATFDLAIVHNYVHVRL